MNFVRTVLLSNPAANGIICSDTNTAQRGWSGNGNAGDSVAALAQFKDTSGNLFTGGLLGAVTGTYGYLAQQASLNKFDPGNTPNSDSFKGDTYFKVGSGTTAATRGDYALESELTNGSVQINLSSTHLMENGCGVLRFFVSVKNIGTESVTVSEIGMFKYLVASNYSTSARADTHFLFGRHVLPTAVTIAPQNTRIFVTDIKI